MKNETVLNLLRNPRLIEQNTMKKKSVFQYENTNEVVSLIDLNGMWDFKYYSKFNNRNESFYKEVSLEDEIPVPSHIELNGYGHIQYVNTQYPWDGVEELIPPAFPEENNQVGQYLKTMKLKNKEKGYKYHLTFDGVELCFNVWVNGEYVGYSEDSHTITQFDITDFLVNGDNVIAVEVYKFGSASWLEDQDQWRLFGIHRNVYVEVVPQVHVSDIKVQSVLDESYKNAEVSIELELSKENEGTIELYNHNSELIYSKEVHINGKDTFTVSLENADLWSAEVPNLYEVKVLLPEQTVTTKFGIREVKIVGNVIFFNGKRIVFNGMNRHEFSSTKGRAISEEEMIFDIKFMKQNNINAVRCSHYPNQDRWYQLCDEYGLYVIDETNLETHGTWQKMGRIDHESKHIVPHDKEEWTNAVLSRGEAMYEQHKNHPSIVMWSCGNESYSGTVLQELTKYFKSVDSTRLVHYEGVFNCRDYEGISDVESRMYASPKDIIEYCENDASQPMMMCEYTHAMGNSNGGLNEYQSLTRKYDHYCGGFVWEYIEHGLEYGDDRLVHYGGDYDDRPTDSNFNLDGLINYDRTMTPKVPELKYTYQPFEMTIQEKSFEIENLYLFKNLSEYDIKVSILVDGLVAREELINLDCEAQTKTQYDFSHLVKEDHYIVLVELFYGKSTKWASKGYELGFEEQEFGVKKQDDKVNLNTPRVAKGDVNIGVYTDHVSYMFNLITHTLISIKVDGEELLNNTRLLPGPTFFRAATDNDFGAFKEFELREWYIASRYRKGNGIKVDIVNNEAVVSTELLIGTVPATKMKINYTINGLGEMKVSMSYQGLEHSPSSFRYGFDFHLKPELNELSWFGKGPYETLHDRKDGSKTSVYKELLDEQFSYTYPQSYGNKTDIRWMELVNDKGVGVLFEAPELFEGTARRYSEYQLSLVDHHNELPTPYETYVVIDKKQVGAIGIDSWGTWVDEKDQIKFDQPMDFEFVVKPFKK